MDVDEQKALDEEAIAEEEFIADVEETMKKNPLVYDGETIGKQDDESPAQEEGDVLAGAVGTGSLTPKDGPFNNEKALRSESVNNDENPFGAEASSGGSFGGPDAAPLSDATETIAPATATQEGASEAMNNNTTETGAASVAAAAPASEPTVADLTNNGTAAAPVAQANSVAPAEAKPKKKKTGLIIGIIVGILVVAAVVAGIIFYNVHESKDRILGDAISSVLLTKASADATNSGAFVGPRQLDGTITMTPEEKSSDSSSSLDLSYKSIVINFKSDENGADFSGTGTFTINLTDSNSISFDLAGAYISGDGLFLKFDKLESAVDKMDFAALFSSTGESMDEMKPYIALIKETLKGTVKEIDGKWYKINAETFSDLEEGKKTYNCLSEAYEKFSGNETRKKIYDIYTEHPFVELDDENTEDGGDGITFYPVKIDKDEQKKFNDGVSGLDAVKKLETCTNSKNKSSNSSKSDDDSKDSFNVKLGIKGWTHELRAAKGNATYDGGKLDFNVKISYENKSVVSPASDAKNLKDVGEDIVNAGMKALKENYPKFAEEMCEQEYGSNKQYVKLCREQLEEQMDEMLEQMVEGFSGSVMGSTIKLN